MIIDNDYTHRGKIQFLLAWLHLAFPLVTYMYYHVQLINVVNVHFTTKTYNSLNDKIFVGTFTPGDKLGPFTHPNEIWQ